METKLDAVIADASASRCNPSLSIQLPVSNKINFRQETAYALKLALDKARTLMLGHYPERQSSLLIEKCEELFSRNIMPPGAQSVVIYVSEEYSKILFVDFVLQERIILDDSFEIRDLVRRAKEAIPFVVLALAAKGNQFYRGSAPGAALQPLLPGRDKDADSFIPDGPQRMATFSDLHERKQQVILRFLRYTDKKLGELIHEYNLPVIVVGTARLMGHFKAITKHARHIEEYIQGNFERLTLRDLSSHLEPHLRLGEKHQRKTMKLLAEEEDKGTVLAGVANVWNGLAGHRGRMLIVEENFHYTAEATEFDAFAENRMPAVPHMDLIDDLIEMALRKGCEIAFVADGALQEKGHVALIEYY